MCDLTKKESLNNLEKIWIPEFIRSNPLDKDLRIKIQLLGTKSDLTERVVISKKDLEDTASRISFLFPEVSILKPCLLTSAKNNLYINESFGVPKGIVFS